MKISHRHSNCTSSPPLTTFPESNVLEHTVGNGVQLSKLAYAHTHKKVEHFNNTNALLSIAFPSIKGGNAI